MRQWQIRYPLLGIEAAPRPPRTRDCRGAHKARSELSESPPGEKPGPYLIPALPVEPQSNYSRH